MEDNIIKIDYDNIDVKDIMQQIRENIRKRNYPSEELYYLKKDLNSSCSEGDFDLAGLEQNVALNNIRWSIQKTNQIRSNRKLLGPLIVIGKRAVRKLSYWYIQFLVDQQNEFNASVANSINEVEKYIKKSKTIMTEMSETLNEKIENLEEGRAKSNEKIEHLEDDKVKLIDMVENLEECKVKHNEKIENLEEGRAKLNEKIEHLEDDKVKLIDMVENLVAKVLNLNEKIDSMDENIIAFDEKKKAQEYVQENIEDIAKRLNHFEEENKKLNDRINRKLEENGRIEEVTADRLRRIERHISYGNDEVLNIPVSNIQHMDSVDMDYFLFESKYRGSRAEIKERQKVYLEYFRDKKHVLDIGCGRGEFIELLGEKNIGVLGIDLNIDNVNYCTDKGLPVKYAEALEYLKSCEDSSLDGIFMAQVAEHLKPNDLISLIRIARKKLKAGAYFIAETINPQSLIVFTDSYYMDPSHIKMVHPLTIKFLVETEGFSDIALKYLSPVSEEQKVPKLECTESCKNLDSFNSAVTRLNDLIYGCRDYAIIAKR